MNEETIVIATENCDKALYIIGKTAMNNERIELHFVNKYAPTVEYLLRMLRKAFGWLEVERSSIETDNTKCKYKENGICIHPKADENLKCNEAIRAHCPNYVKKYEQKIRVNTITIEKVGAIRGLE
jgi:hypothetical protein